LISALAAAVTWPDGGWANSGGGMADRAAHRSHVVGRTGTDTVSSQLEAARARVTPLFASAIVPVRDTTTLDTALRNARRYDGIVVTRLAAVESVARRLAALCLGRDACRHISIALLGPANARADEIMASRRLLTSCRHHSCRFSCRR
jgi:hypothetical protein